MTKFLFRYYVFQANFKDQNICIKYVLKMQMLNNPGLIYKSYFTIVKN